MNGHPTHLDKRGHVHMVDVGDKPQTRRRAVAEGCLLARADTLAAISDGRVPKGDVLATARVAGIMAAKRASELIPLCHPLPLTRVEVDLIVEDNRVVCRCVAETVGRTGVEIEALAAVQIALLTIYDMCKAMDRSMRLTDIALLEKAGGTSGHWNQRPSSPA